MPTTIQLYTSDPATLSNADFKALPTNQVVEIVPAPGANKLIQFVKGLVIGDTDAGGYTNIAADALAFFRVDNQVSTRIMNASVGQVTNWLEMTWKSAVIFNPYIGWNSVQELSIVQESDGLSNYVNKPLQFVLANSDGDFTGGHADNNFIISAEYYVIDV